MFYLKLVLLIVGLVAIGVVNYLWTCRTARKLLELYKNG
jgi:hypothetical protein